MLGVRGAHDIGVGMRMREGVAQHERRATLSLLPQVVEAGVLELLPEVAGTVSHTGLPLGHSPTDDYAVSIENQELIEGVENMQIMYGVDTDQDGIPENYYVAGVATLNDDTAWGNVVSVKIALLLRTVETGFGSDTKTYSLLGVDNVNPIDMGVRRRVFTTTIQLRNRISR